MIPSIAAAFLLLPGIQKTTGTDLILQVLEDEMTRSVQRLRLENREGPYYVEYAVRENDTYTVTASFGSLTQQDRSRRRQLGVDLRVGDYSLDNTNFSEEGGFTFYLGGGGSFGGKSIPVEDDYEALRHALWLQTDEAYKEAVEDLEKKKAYLQENTVKDRPDDLSKESPATSIEPLAKLEVDEARWAGVAKKLSAIFREFPDVQKSLVTFIARSKNRWFLNNEGFRNRSGGTAFGLVVLAGAQAADGMRFADYELFGATEEKGLPPQAEMEKAVRGLAGRLSALVKAPALEEEYRGPVLLEGQAAGEFFSQTLTPNLSSPHEPIGKSNPMAAMAGNQWREKIGTKVAAPFLTVVDDPTLETLNGTPLLGGYEVDDDGVKAQRITLIEKGILKTHCMSRIPTRHIKQSNGHSRNGNGSTSTLLVESDSKTPLSELRKKLLDLGKEEGLDHVFVARRLSNATSGRINPRGMISSMFSRGGEGGVNLLPPVLLYRVSVADGKEELVRGARFGKLTLRVLRDIEQTGDDAKPYLMAQGYQDATQIVAPSVLLKEIEISKPGKESEKPTVLRNPFFEE